MTPTLSADDARRAARNAGAIAAASLISKGALFAWQLILARALGETVYGIYGTVGAFNAVGTALVGFGLGVIVIREVARHPELAGKYLSATLVLQTALGLLSYILVNATAALTGYPPDIRAYLALAALSLVVDVWGTMAADVLLARERMVIVSALNVAHITGLIALAAVALALGYGLWGVYIATIVAGLGRSLAFWLALRRVDIRPQWPFDRAIAGPLLANGAPLALSAFLALAYQHADKLMTTRFIGDTAQTGYLTAAFIVVFGVIELLSTTVLTATYPLLARYQGAGDTFGFMVEKLAFFTLVITLPLALALLLFAPALIVPLFGPGYAPTAEVLRVLIWYAVAAMAANIFAQALLAQNRQRRLLAIRASGLGLNIILNLLLIPRLGIIGAALASLGAELLALTALVGSFQAEGWAWRRIVPRLGWLLLLAAAVALAMALVDAALPGLLLGALIYALGLARGPVFAPADWDLLYRLAAALPGGGLVRRYWRRETAINW
jgi:O-antigen/teichoic acid export membrane protein